MRPIRTVTELSVRYMLISEAQLKIENRQEASLNKSLSSGPVTKDHTLYSLYERAPSDDKPVFAFMGQNS